MHLSRWAVAAYVCLIFAAVGFFQLHERAYPGEFTAHSDEAAHFVSGICVLDYLATSLGSNPVSFVESYYARYPRVALGHWPPLFYAVQAAWYATLGATALNAILLVGMITAIAASVLFFRLKWLYGTTTTVLSIAVFLWLPLVRASVLMVMPDLLASLLMLLAILAFADARIRGQGRFLVAFAAWTSAAVLTKESALTLILFAPVMLILAKPNALAARKKAWRVAAIAAAAMAIPLLIYPVSGVWRLRGLPQAVGVASFRSQLQMLMSFFAGASIIVFLVAVCAVFNALRRWKSLGDSERGIHFLAALVWLVITLACQLVTRNVIEDRYFLPALFALVIVFAEGLQSLIEAMEARFRRPWPVLAAACLTLACILSTPPLTLPRRTGYAQIAASIPYDSLGPVILVSSDSLGEGALIAERLLADPARAGLVLRASKMLASSNWLGTDVKLRMDSANQIRAFLDSEPVNYIVVDMDGYTNGIGRAGLRLLEETVRREPDHFRQVGDFPLYFAGRRRDSAVQVFENLNTRGRRPDHIRIDMAKTLGRDLNVPLQPRSGPATRWAASWSFRLAAVLEKMPRRDDGPTTATVAPQGDEAAPDGDTGRIYISAPAYRAWSFANVPAWIKISAGSGSGNGVVGYRVAANDSNEPRSAAIAVGEMIFRLSQPSSGYIYVPFFEKFTPEPRSADVPRRWVLEERSVRTATLRISTEEPSGPRSLVIYKPRADKKSWHTQLYLPAIKTEAGGKYHASFWVKAENPALVVVKFAQRRAPYTVCSPASPVRVSADWTRVNVRFQAAPECTADNDRLTIETGFISGKFWVAKLALVRDPP
jgi:hypothetical protein